MLSWHADVTFITYKGYWSRKMHQYVGPVIQPSIGKRTNIAVSIRNSKSN